MCRYVDDRGHRALGRPLQIAVRSVAGQRTQVGEKGGPLMKKHLLQGRNIHRFKVMRSMFFC